MLLVNHNPWPKDAHNQGDGEKPVSVYGELGEQVNSKASRGRGVRGPQGQEEAQGADLLCLLCNVPLHWSSFPRGQP